MPPITRRDFVRGSSATIFFMGMPACRTAIPTPPVRSANEEIRVGVIGIRSRGRAHINGFHRLPNVSVVALCDVDENVLAREAKAFHDRDEKVDTYKDLRAMLDRDDIDAVAVASPNHWHALNAVWACQAGKDVYLEKPVSHNIWEGGQIVKAARKYKRIVQTGTQSRSSQGIREGIEWLQAGNLGTIQLARGLCYKPRKSIGKVKGPQQVPEAIDYDLWTGPAPLTPLMRKNLHYDWHWVFDTGNGDVGNQGIHQMDMARWALGESKLSKRVMSVGGRFGYDDDGNTPNTQIVMHDYDTAPLYFEVRGLPRDKKAQKESWNGGGMDSFMGAKIGVIIHCSNGFLRIPNYTSAIAYDLDGAEIQSWKGARDHFANFIDVVRSRRVEDLNADIHEGHVSSGLCHMGNVSHLLGKEMPKEEVEGLVASDSQAKETYDRFCAHLDANGVDLAKTPPIVGPSLEMHQEQEMFQSDAANQLLARDYRAPFVVPKRV